ncbi:MAG: hypothetical protein KME05_24235 [Gloeocapsa sp. UFS-A4-WI-NPMV-4B04]|nr:hypothetical protein [Gloeocapsa sp. UFS-A4-WI-NPMV-4B04]
MEIPAAPLGSPSTEHSPAQEALTPINVISSGSLPFFATFTVNLGTRPVVKISNAKDKEPEG